MVFGECVGAAAGAVVSADNGADVGVGTGAVVGEFVRGPVCARVGVMVGAVSAPPCSENTLTCAKTPIPKTKAPKHMHV